MEEIKINQIGARGVFILPILAAVISFGLTFSSCKDCDKAEDKDKDNLVTGKTTNKPDNPAVPGNPTLPSDNSTSNALLCQLAVKEAQDAESKVKSAMIKVQEAAWKVKDAQTPEAKEAQLKKLRDAQMAAMEALQAIAKALDKAQAADVVGALEAQKSLARTMIWAWATGQAAIRAHQATQWKWNENEAREAEAEAQEEKALPEKLKNLGMELSSVGKNEPVARLAMVKAAAADAAVECADLAAKRAEKAAAAAKDRSDMLPATIQAAQKAAEEARTLADKMKVDARALLNF